ncbi:MAG: N-6 DNA methylase [bacterium]|nr:N-6 DNA methylase [bacterium]
MEILQANISLDTADLLKDIVKGQSNYQSVNRELEEMCGIVDFFMNRDDYLALKDEIKNFGWTISDHNKIEYGDFQTPLDLADKVCLYLAQKKVSPNLVLEPTCGKGNFIISALEHIKSIDKIYGIEIYKPYVWECKFNIIDFYLKNPNETRASVRLFHENVFDFDFTGLEEQLKGEEVLIVGNPPWVTNSILGGLNSQNLPVKSNLKAHSGLDAITGKGNFDISEYISLMMLDHFSGKNGHMAFLVKSSVVKNIIQDLGRSNYKIDNLEKLIIDAGKEFNASVDASLFSCRFNKEPVYQCKEQDFYIRDSRIRMFGWVENKFVSDVELYRTNKDYDGISPLVWRSGHKHDCSKIMELKKLNGGYVNKLRETIELEDDLVFEFLKSSDLKSRVIRDSQKFTIVTQKRIGASTQYIKENYPLTYKYLEEKEKFFLDRKSSIYKNKPRFSIFGIGDYTFKRYKVAISGLYKRSTFSLIVPRGEKPILLDDTCYFLGFDVLSDALYTYTLLNNPTTQELLRSLVFLDSKRAYTKDLLMRIDLVKIALSISLSEIEIKVKRTMAEFENEITEETWDRYLRSISQNERRTVQLSLF